MLDHTWEWWFTQGGPALGGIASFLLILYYARLYNETKEQTKATKASYAPSLDTRIEYEDEDILLTVINRGQGVAKNVRFGINMTVDEQTSGYLAEFDTTLPPNHLIRFNEEDCARLTPTITKFEGRDSVQESPYAKLSDMVEKYSVGYFEIGLSYTDILEQREYSEDILDRHTTIEDAASLQTVLQNRSRGTGLNEWFTTPTHISLLGPDHIPLKKRLWYFKQKIIDWLYQKKPFERGATAGATYFGPMYRVRIEGEAIEYPSEDTETSP